MLFDYLPFFCTGNYKQTSVLLYKLHVKYGRNALKIITIF